MEMIKISEFKHKMGRYLKRVREGRQIVLANRDIPVATISPYQKKDRSIDKTTEEPLRLIPPEAGFAGIDAIKPAQVVRHRQLSSLEALLAERDDR